MPAILPSDVTSMLIPSASSIAPSRFKLLNPTWTASTSLSYVALVFYSLALFTAQPVMTEKDSLLLDANHFDRMLPKGETIVSPPFPKTRVLSWGVETVIIKSVASS
jgi:hypothetical protein